MRLIVYFDMLFLTELINLCNSYFVKLNLIGKSVDSLKAPVHLLAIHLFISKEIVSQETAIARSAKSQCICCVA